MKEVSFEFGCLSLVSRWCFNDNNDIRMEEMKSQKCTCVGRDDVQTRTSVGRDDVSNTYVCCVGIDDVLETIMEGEFRNILGCFDGEDGDENRLGYILLRDCSVSQENKDKMDIENK